METFFSISVLVFASVIGFFFGAGGFLVVFLLGVFFQCKQKWSERRKLERAELLATIRSLKESK